jgi:hypothetical protein
MERDRLRTKSPLADRLVTDGRFIVEEVDGRAFWPGQPFLADCGISASYRPAEHTAIYARRLAERYNAHWPIVRAARELLRTMPKPRKGPAREAYETLWAWVVIP